nr:hypothetical protein [Trinickia terrae]
MGEPHTLNNLLGLRHVETQGEHLVAEWLREIGDLLGMTRGHGHAIAALEDDSNEKCAEPDLSAYPALV